MELWYPKASRTQLAGTDGGSFTGGPPKGVLHTTETTGWPAYATDYWPHFTTRWADGAFHVRQHLPINRAARALANPSGGVQTNRDTAIQIECVGTCDTSKRASWGALYVEDWAAGYKAGLADLMRWVEFNAGVPRRCTVTFKPYPASYGANGVRLSGAAWDAYAGWCGHQHVPENDHGDPGAIDIGYLLGGENDVDVQELYDKLTDPNETYSIAKTQKAVIKPGTTISRLDAIDDKLKLLAEQPLTVTLAPEQLAELRAGLAAEVADLIAARLKD